MKITFKTIESEGFAGRSMFHPKAALHPSGRLHMAIQTIGGGDYYGPVEYSYSDDKGYTWKKPEYIEELRWLELKNSAAEYQGVCDTVVNYDPASDSMVFMGHTVYYKNNRYRGGLTYKGRHQALSGVHPILLHLLYLHQLQQIEYNYHVLPFPI